MYGNNSSMNGQGGGYGAYGQPHQQQGSYQQQQYNSQTYGNSNPFAQYNPNQQAAPAGGSFASTEQQQQAMVATPSQQYANQWALQQQAPAPQPQPTQQQQPTQVSAAPVSVPKNTQFDPMDPFAGNAPELVPQPMYSTGVATDNQPDPLAAFSAPTAPPATSNANPGYQPAPPAQEYVPQPVPPAVNSTDDDDDFFGVFSMKSTEPPATANPAIIETRESHDTMSVLSGGTDLRSKGRNAQGSPTSQNSNGGSRTSPLDNPKFAPPPPKFRGLENSERLARQAPPTASPLPRFDLVTHSGFCMARISFRTILIKKWKQVFWVTYGHNKLLVFRSVSDFQDWVANPYLSQAQRDFLIKLKIDFVEDTYKMNVRGYQATNIRMKAYQTQMLNQFKLERWMDYGPTIAAAFASPNEGELRNLRVLLTEMMKRSPQDSGFTGVQQHNNAFTMLNNSGTYDSQPNNNGAGPYADRNMNSALSVGDSRSLRSGRSYGVMSTGPVERNSHYASYGR